MQNIDQIPQHTPFSLVLSGGGALAYAHLGILHDLEKKGLSPSEIVGTSMGGIIGACVAIGLKEAQITQLLEAFASLPKWVEFRWGGNALIATGKLGEIFGTVFGDRTMKQTDLPLKLIATNLQTGEKRVFGRNDNIFIRDALLATIAIPGIFSEKEIGGHFYGDGFLCENLGVNEAEYQTVLASDVLGKHSFKAALPDNFFKPPNILEMVERSMRLLIYNQTGAHLRCCDKAVMLLEPPTSDFKTFQFHKLHEIRKRGLGLYSR